MVVCELCFCTDFKNVLRLEKIAFPVPVICESKITVCACRPCISNLAKLSLPKISTSKQPMLDFVIKRSSIPSNSYSLLSKQTICSLVPKSYKRDFLFCTFFFLGKTFLCNIYDQEKSTVSPAQS